jgi:hypothetical protein
MTNPPYSWSTKGGEYPAKKRSRVRASLFNYSGMLLAVGSKFLNSIIPRLMAAAENSVVAAVTIQGSGYVATNFASLAAKGIQISLVGFIKGEEIRAKKQKPPKGPLFRGE